MAPKGPAHTVHACRKAVGRVKNASMTKAVAISSLKYLKGDTLGTATALLSHGRYQDG